MDYKIQINEHYPTKKNKFIYLITKNDDWYYYSGIRDLSFDIVDRQMILDFMNKQQTDNDIFNDYKDYLNKIEIETNSFNKYHNIITNSYAAEGFYLKLKNIIMEKNLLTGSTTMLLLKLLEEADMYGYQMIDELTKKSKNVFELKAGTLYPLLHTLEQKELVTSYEKTADNAKVRKYYSLTENGHNYLNEKKKEWKTYTSAVNDVLGGATFATV